MDVRDASALPCRRDSLSSADKAATRRLVRRTFAKAVDTQGKDLGQVRLFLVPLLGLKTTCDGGEDKQSVIAPAS